MQAKQVRLVLPLLLTLCLCGTASAQQAGRIESMKLLTPSVGWAMTKSHLFWTADSGAQWKDITPRSSHKWQAVSSVFFLDQSTGWVLLNCADHRFEDLDPRKDPDDTCFEVASTASAGESWSFSHPKVLNPDPEAGFSGRSYLSFADQSHGWMILKVSRSTAVSFGVMLATADGGKSWKQLPQPPIAEPFRFETARDGWLAGGPSHELYVTRDAGNSWQAVSLQKPSQVGPDRGTVYDLPVFENPSNGFLPVRFKMGSELEPPATTVALFATDNGGRTWTLDRIQPKIPDPTDGWLPIAVPDSTLLAAAVSTGHMNLMQTPHGAEAKSQSAAIPAHALTADQLSFVTPQRGWVLATYWVLSTADGGVTWVDVTPDPAGTVPALASAIDTTYTATVRSNRIGRPVSSPATSSSVSTHLGFDKSDTIPSPQMSTLMASSPFYDTYIYLPGSPNRHVDPTLTKPWVSAIEGQGWGIIPVWFGLQSTCAISQAGITQFISTVPATASTQGLQQADLAVASDKALNINSGIIYLDIENYTVGGACSVAVQDYVAGFVGEVGTYSGFSAGVYSNPSPIQNDISQVTPPPSAIWIAKTPPKSNPVPSVTIWNQGIPDSSTTNSMYWPNNQRMHQFLIQQAGVNFGGVTFSPYVDEDIDNGPVVNANTGVKTYSSYNYSSSINYPGAIVSEVYSINDIWDGSMINGPGQVGQVVGQYTDSSGVQHGMLVDGLVGYTSIDYPSATQTVATGINNSSQIVGYWSNSTSGQSGGFYLDNGTCSNYCSFSYPGGADTTPLGINDAGQIVGTYGPGSPNYGFLYYRGKGGAFYSISYPGGDQTLAGGINGDGTVAGEYSNTTSINGFVEYAIPPSWTGTFSQEDFGGALNTYLMGINNDNVMTGYYWTSTSPVEGFQFYNVFYTSFQYPGTGVSTYLCSTNDFGQAAGTYINANGYDFGFVAVPQ